MCDVIRLSLLLDARCSMKPYRDGVSDAKNLLLACRANRDEINGIERGGRGR